MQQDSKQIQVDLQDLGYETCGRSENEAEREDTSSPGIHPVHSLSAERPVDQDSSKTETKKMILYVQYIS